MEVRFLKVLYARLRDKKQKPRIVFNGDWLAEAGFEIDTLVMAELSMGEIVFKLCDLGSDSFYGLICEAKQHGKTLLRVSSCVSRGKARPVLDLRCDGLSGFGFHAGAQIAVMAEFGTIRAKAIDMDTFIGNNFPAAM